MRLSTLSAALVLGSTSLVQAADYHCTFVQRCEAAGCTDATDLSLTLATAPDHALLTDPLGTRLLAALPAGGGLRSFAAHAGAVGEERAEMFSLYANGDFLYTTHVDGAALVFVTGSGHCTGAS